MNAKVVESPVLSKIGCDLSEKYIPWFCLGELREFVEVPEADNYQLEVRRTQWPDKSGTGGRVKIDDINGNPFWWNSLRRAWRSLHPAVIPKLKELGVMGKPKRVWFRLLYWENEK